MKKMLLLFLLLTILAPTQAQTTKDPYIPVLGENKVWYTAERWEFGEVVSTVFYTSTTEIINGIEYTRIINQEGTIYAYLRENLVERKIYLKAGADEYLLYDFSLEVGDSFYMEVSALIWYNVIAIENIETNEGYKIF